ncbi:phosphate/phosphite/phosphonate ABC transporter substrate-binding protein [Pontibacterium sp.]|uniref:phosphate/phosphite/phosphonate ABC transporter substrate-binding protein n=1 Tax=Pontibacterium sp. TaxID=2036026 RepID=UPI003567D4E8
MKKLAPLFIATLLSTPVVADTFTVGVVPQFDVKTLHKIWDPILQEVSQRTGHSFKLKGSPDIPTFEKEFAEAKFDFAYMNPYHYTIAQHYKPLLRDTGRKLFGVLVVKKGSGINSLEQLQNSTIAFPAPNALGASLMIRGELKEIYNIDFTPKYVKTHSSVYLNTVLGRTLSGGGVQKTFNNQKAEIKDKLEILHQTQKVSPHPFVYKASLPSNVAEQVKAALLNMAQSADTQALLAKVPFKKIGLATDADYDDVRRLNLERYYVKPN